MNIEIKYFAALREQAGISGEKMMTESRTPSELFDELNRKYHFSLNKNHLKVAINDQYASFETPLKSQDLVVFIPPVAGG